MLSHNYEIVFHNYDLVCRNYKTVYVVIMLCHMTYGITQLRDSVCRDHDL